MGPPAAPLGELSTAWNRFNFGRYFLNSFIVSVAVTILNVPASGPGRLQPGEYRYFGQRALFHRHP